MLFSYSRTVRFQDTDAAGVVYFANLLAMCHEAYEESLAASRINVKEFFSSTSGFAVPIVHANIDFLRPLFCGDEVVIELIPKQLSDNSFEVCYQVLVAKKVVAKAITRHVCIDVSSRSRKALSADLVEWLRKWG
jgi:1,4-dihydroxy-2-naphthoyl-CoA hydrolase